MSRVSHSDAAVMCGGRRRAKRENDFLVRFVPLMIDVRADFSPATSPWLLSLEAALWMEKE